MRYSAAADLPVLIDEWQLVPDILGAVKRSVDLGAAPGSYVLTGSWRADLQTEGWPATGRVLFHTGPVAFQLDERIWALSIAAIWT
jgi:hypothetical protein